MDEPNEQRHWLKRLGCAVFVGAAAWSAAIAVVAVVFFGGIEVVRPLVVWPLVVLAGPALFIPATPDLWMRMVGVAAEFGIYAWILVPRETRLRRAGAIIALHLVAAALAVGIAM